MGSDAIRPTTPARSPRRRIRRAVARHLAAVVSWLLPPLCPRCGGRAEHPAEQFCPACWAGLRPLREEDAAWLVAADAGEAFRAQAAFAVDPLFIAMLSASKYAGARPVGRRLAAEAADRLAPSLAAGVLVPVPLTAAKRRERGFNQPEDFARALAARTGAVVRTDWLARTRSGPALAGLERRRRTAAVRGAFGGNPGAAPPDGPVILVDDVVTTGSTATACREAALAAGAGRVSVVAMARAFQTAEDAVARRRELADRL